MAAFVDWNSLIFGSPQDPQRSPAAPFDNVEQPQPWQPQRPISLDIRSAPTAAAAFVGFVLLLWYWLGRRRHRRLSDPSARLAKQEEVINAVQEDCHRRIEAAEKQFADVLEARAGLIEEQSQKALLEQTGVIETSIREDYDRRIEATEKQFADALKQRASLIEEQFREALGEQTDTIETSVRKGLNKRVESLEVRIKLDQEALEDVHGVLARRIAAFEDYIRTIDSKQLDQEANNIAQRDLGQRLASTEESLRTVDGRARASAQRIEAMDDSVRIIDSRTKALSQRVEAVEDNQNSIDGQVTLLSHDVSRGGSAVERLQRQVKMLPDVEKFKELSRSWEAKFRKLETKLDEYEKALEEKAAAETAPTLTWSQIESQEIEPVGPLYTRPARPTGPTRPFSYSFEGSMSSPSTTSSFYSPSVSSGHSRTYSTASTTSSSAALPSPTITPERRRPDLAGFRDTTFSSRQRLLASKNSWSK
ncbi:hypothetical protein GGR56DRAFT_402559 [Xylariaceae sp. FL0804]|nr:hypothetical protein GGR56DRAFT_402559 [Xylariaceae sp. FL0804]